MARGISINRGDIPYQVDYTHVESGKHFQFSKRRIRFIFGFASETALKNGQRGAFCRGDEHEVVLVWSCNSGKQLLICDGKEIVRRVDRGSNKFEYTFYLGDHVVIFVGHASIMPNLIMNPSKQFDLKVDGRSFFSMLKIYELGLSPLDDKRLIRMQEDRLVRIAKELSVQKKPISQARSRSFNEFQMHPLNDDKKKLSTPFHPQEVTIMSFMKQPSDLTNGPPNEVVISNSNVPHSNNNQGNNNILKNAQEEPWEVLVDFASLKGNEQDHSHPTHDYFDYYNDYVKRGGEAISHPNTPKQNVHQPNSVQQNPYHISMTQFDPYSSTLPPPRARAYTAPEYDQKTSYSSYSVPSQTNIPTNLNDPLPSHSAHGYSYTNQYTYTQPTYPPQTQQSYPQNYYSNYNHSSYIPNASGTYHNGFA